MLFTPSVWRGLVLTNMAVASKRGGFTADSPEGMVFVVSVCLNEGKDIHRKMEGFK